MAREGKGGEIVVAGQANRSGADDGQRLAADSQPHDLAGAHALVRGENDAQGIQRVFVMA
jgi:hypothetical protein